MKHQWSKAEADEAAELRLSLRWSLSEIGSYFGRSAHAVHGILWRRGITSGRTHVRWNAADASHVIGLAASGMPTREISTTIKRSTYSIRQLLKRKGIKLDRSLSAVRREAEKKKKKWRATN